MGVLKGSEDKMTSLFISYKISFFFTSSTAGFLIHFLLHDSENDVALTTCTAVICVLSSAVTYIASETLLCTLTTKCKEVNDHE